MKKILYLIFLILLYINPATASWLNLTPSGDTYISSTNDVSNYGSLTVMRVGNYDGESRSLLNFSSLSGIPSASFISSATISLYVSYENCVAGNGVLYNITSTWNEGSVVWLSKPSIASSSLTSVNLCSGTGRKTFSIRDNVQYIVSNGGGNHGWEIVPSSFDTLNFAAIDKREDTNLPYLNISYDANLPSVPILSVHTNYHNSGSTTVSLSSASTDADGDSVTYDFKVGTTSSGTNVLNQVGNGVTGSTSSTSSNSFTMTPTNNYYWSSRSCDGYTCSAWSTESSFFYIASPPAPTNIQSTTGNFWINTTWQSGGVGTDSYNVSINGT